jgi:patatin-like phospholipase/acyl hydrolase
MEEIEIEEKKVRGFAGIIDNALSPLNSNQIFQERFRTTELKIVLNAKNANYAALIIVDRGILRIESIKNKPPENLKKKEIGWDALLEMDTQTFLAIAMNRISMLGVAIKWITGKIRMKGIRKLLNLLKIFKLLSVID